MTFITDSFELPTDLTPAQIKVLIDGNPPPGAKLRKYTVTAILNAIFYLIKSGCQWRMLPPHFPKWRTVYNHFRLWSDRGWFQTVLRKLVIRYRKKMGRKEMPWTAVVGSQSIRQVYAPSEKGVDGYKRIKGIKLQLAVDSQGYPLVCHVATLACVTFMLRYFR